MDDTTLKDIASLNKRYLYLVKQLATDGQSNLLVGIPKQAIVRIKSMTMDEIDELAEDMVVLCFTFKFDDETFRAFVERKATRRAYMTNILFAQSQP